MDRFFGPGNPGALFKRPANVYNFHDTVMASVAFRSEQVTKPGAHSSSANNEDFEDVSLVDKLAIRIHQEAQEHSLREEASKLQDLALKKRRRMLLTSWLLLQHLYWKRGLFLRLRSLLEIIIKSTSQRQRSTERPRHTTICEIHSLMLMSMRAKRIFALHRQRNIVPPWLVPTYSACLPRPCQRWILPHAPLQL